LCNENTRALITKKNRARAAQPEPGLSSHRRLQRGAVAREAARVTGRVGFQETSASLLDAAPGLRLSVVVCVQAGLLVCVVNGKIKWVGVPVLLLMCSPACLSPAWGRVAMACKAAAAATAAAAAVPTRRIEKPFRCFFGLAAALCLLRLVLVLLVSCPVACGACRLCRAVCVVIVSSRLPSSVSARVAARRLRALGAVKKKM
jgi:hypothetical protein